VTTANATQFAVEQWGSRSQLTAAQFTQFAVEHWAKTTLPLEARFTQFGAEQWGSVVHPLEARATQFGAEQWATAMYTPPYLTIRLTGFEVEPDPPLFAVPADGPPIGVPRPDGINVA